jgi:DNA-binding winged helix-turn-helix (wHTH) protein
VIRYRFSEFTLSPQRRLLVREGHEVPLIPRYFDLLLLLVERRREAVHRREIFERVWGEVNVSDSALSQAVRTIRSTLGDDSREPRFIRTVSRHGYQFVFPEVVEEPDDGDAASASVRTPIESAPHSTTTAWTGGSAGGALAGIAAGALGGLILALAPDSSAPIALAPVLAVIGGTCGALGGAGIGAGVAFAETRAYSPRVIVLPIAAAIGGGAVGFVVQWLSRWALAALVGLDINIGGGLEGVVIGAAAGLGFAIATRSTPDGSEEPRGGRRLQAALIIALLCGTAGLAITLTGRPLAGGTIHKIADAADGSRATLTPLGHLIGEPDFGPVTSATLAFGEAATFGLGLALGVLRNRRV